MQKINEIKKLNQEIIALENKKTKDYAKNIDDSLKKMQEMLERHETSKPKEVQKPEPKEANVQYTKKLADINNTIETTKEKIELVKSEIVKLNNSILETQDFISKINTLQLNFDELKLIEEAFVKEHNIILGNNELKLSTPQNMLNDFQLQLQTQKSSKQNELENSETGLNTILEIAEEKKRNLIANTDTEEKIYQKYLSDLYEWNEKKTKIIGTVDDDESLKFFEKEKDFLEKELNTMYESLREERKNKLKELHAIKKRKISLYEDIYAPIEGEITNLLGDLEDSISFKAEIQQSDPQFDSKVLNNINQRYAGAFKGAKEAHLLMSKIIKETEFDNDASVIDMIAKIMQAVDEDIDMSEKKIINKQEFYDFLYSLEYIGISFKLKMGGRDLDELSPGERGIVLLIFYLALSKNNMLIIIDQPEDNLDNQSVFNKLVPCICKAKQKRQVIIVTHNPNIAVACDAEQIIYCSMDKNKSKIEYTAGAIENFVIKEYVIDVLEGTMPAFDLRRLKYD